MSFYMNAIVCLTRGYKDAGKYETLLKRNAAIYKFFGNKYPVLIFHEGNISSRQQKYISSRHEMDVQFHNIADRWKGGYEGMCRFYTWDLWDVCQHYEYIFRVDEDCELTEMQQDPFEKITGSNIPEEKRCVYLKSVYWAESHSETNATLPQIIERLTGESDFYNGQFPYTNVSLSSVKFWREGKVNEVLKAIALSPDQRINRWGDLPVLGSLLNVYAKGKVGTLTGMKYYHLSHNVTVECK